MHDSPSTQGRSASSPLTALKLCTISHDPVDLETFTEVLLIAAAENAARTNVTSINSSIFQKKISYFFDETSYCTATLYDNTDPEGPTTHTIIYMWGKVYNIM